MSESRIELTIGMCVIALTKHIMKKNNLHQEEAYKKLLASELYKVLKDPETRLLMETNDYLCEAYDEEVANGVDAFYTYINNN